MTRFENKMEHFIFASRWVQAPLYLGLIVASVLYAYKFLLELIHLFVAIPTISEEHLMMGVLTLVDFVMVGNLLVMVVIGGYATFVSKMDLVDNHKDRPDWLDHIDAGTLKIKMAGALVGISGIHLLKTFININEKDTEKVLLQILIHGVFLFSAVLLAWTEKIMSSYKHHGTDH
ncbi:MAG: TIGR00645 family protein [Bdellovibrio sp.]